MFKLGRWKDNLLQLVCRSHTIMKKLIFIIINSLGIHNYNRLDGKGDVKVGDFGLAEDMYSTGYVRESSKTMKIPFKWMPPESLDEGLFSEKSDVVNYHVPPCRIHDICAGLLVAKANLFGKMLCV